jgi:DNA oxidative demethylase
MVTPGGRSVAPNNCGQVRWVTDRNGYRYDAVDPVTSRRWPEMLRVFAD